MSIEELETALAIPSFEEELAMTAIPGRLQEKSAKIMTCPNCGHSTVVGPGETFKCPSGPHDIEDDNLSDIELAEYTQSYINSDEY